METWYHFQWQNEFLRKTIYPMRETKLRDFLTYFAEIEIWAKYKDKDAAALEGEAEEYKAAQAKAVVQAYEEYLDARDYFMTLDVRERYEEKFGGVSEEEMKRIETLHAACAQSLPKLADVRREKNFVQMQEPQWLNRRQEVMRQIASKKRRVDAIAPEHPRRPQELAELEALEEIALPMVDEELIRLRRFLKTFEKIESRKLTLFKSQEAALRRKDEIKRKLPTLQTNLAPLQAKAQSLQADLNRMQTPPDRQPLESHFGADLGALLAPYPQAGEAFRKQLGSLRQALKDELGYRTEDRSKLSALRTHLFNWQQALKSLQKEASQIETNLKNMPLTWARRPQNETRLQELHKADLPALEGEVEKLALFYAALEHATQSPAERSQKIAAQQKEWEKVRQNLAIFEKQKEDLLAELTQVEATLQTDQEAYLKEYAPQTPINAKDLARWRVEEYEASLAAKNHDQLLREIVQQFTQNPQKYPLWLQYMVIHFSGMRYKSAHGSWASPRNFLLRWHSHHLQKELQTLDDAAIQARCREEISRYGGPAAPALASAPEKGWATKRETNLKGIASSGPKTRRASLLALLTDEREYALNLESETQTLQTLEAMREQFPGWMWKELVALTPLRVNHVQDLGWEKLSAEEEAQKNAFESGELRALLNKWKEDHTSLWRDEHGRTQQLIVSRAVCNETAEHCQHLRGHLPPGGLTAKAPWYMKHEKENALPGEPRPYFTKPKKITDFTVGASILWLRFVSEEMSPWRVARPLVTKDGDSLLPPEFRRGSPGGWKYTETEVITRSRSALDAEKKPVVQEQWLRWIHEATVAATGETAEGAVVLTFETALPDDDPGLSSIGLFRIWLSNALFVGTEDNYNGSFVGFVPEGNLPTEALKEMLDWQKILPA